LTAFIDPRTDPTPGVDQSPAPTTEDPDELADLHRLCREGYLYEVEHWIRAARPLQLAEARATHQRRQYKSALEIAMDQGNYALALLLLCNGYDPNREYESPLNLALRSRRFDLVDLLLDWGADPHDVDPGDVFDTYRSEMFERFRKLGVDLTADHALALTLAYHTSNKPLFGFARRHRKDHPKFQSELNIALAYHAAEGNEKGVALCLWAGADPHAPALCLRYWSATDHKEDEDEEDFFGRYSAIHEACSRGDVKILERLGPDPALDDFDELYRVAGSAEVVEFLARFALPQDGGEVIRRHLWGATWVHGFWSESDTWRSREILGRLFQVGVRWEESNKDELALIRRWLLRASKHDFVEVMTLLAAGDHCDPEILKELARTPAMRRRMKEVGFIPPSPDERGYRPTRSRKVLKKCDFELPKDPLARCVYLGHSRPNTREIRMTRADFFRRVWSKPATRLAKEWGFSDTWLKKECRRLKVPMPPRGYWAKRKAGKPVSRPRRPRLPRGEAEEIVVWGPE
jgi:hypothetical protein